MHSRKPFFIFVALLFISGISASIYRSVEHNVPFFPGKQVQSWSVEAKVMFNGTSKPAEASLSLPQDPAFDVLAENATSAGYGLNISEGEDRRAVWSIREASGRQSLYYRVTLVPTGQLKVDADEEPVTPEPFLWQVTERGAAEQIINQVWERSASNISYAQQLMDVINDSNQSQNLALLLSVNSRTQLFVQMLQSKGVPAKLVSGLMLEDQRRRQQLNPYVQVYQDGEWILFDVENNKQGRPDNLVLWQHNGMSVLDVIGGSNSQVNFSMLKETRSALATSIDMMMNTDSLDFSLYQLPLEEQSTFKGILLIPIGVLVVVFLRVIIGIKTSGTFMPVLIALAFIQTTLLTGLIGFLLIVAFGLMIRSYLSQLNLLLISRISAVIIVVIFIIGLFTLISYKLGLSEGLTITFFPMIILAWTIERMSILWEEEGPKSVFMSGGGSLFVATLAYLAMSNSWIQHWVFNFLGIHLVILAMVLVMGQYTGYRLTELKRFKPLAEDK
ncbi:UUP1 family membrane protein [Shewanella sp. 1_MG-2023]|uniref:UUP1 family membrane protein n=1 Tax=Shewanella electrodiphila TaxID=934143 RepID=A0ABT0KMP3_9GAMM|nr:MULTISPECIES: UUP1 family membrane protein [Shewanella]MCC4831988.1 UUP1 family membrane protein [Shewanella sp. 10N.7]MCL1045123.1 UUP1 family membrane protein [Shewanella electrodiphila]MDO6613354.1 UUP1 family membrane protein [Shewanella sp. 7_MG-2023]MDO6773162.1 UUP1 family membrane protein [Shewanella sp. 2_MG-2023]MDO6795364.1 UUP1 family membrane protein [Shewanella sp. 1_MG-2023]